MFRCANHRLHSLGVWGGEVMIMAAAESKRRDRFVRRSSQDGIREMNLTHSAISSLLIEFNSVVIFIYGVTIQL